MGLGSGGGVTRGEVLASAGGTKTPGPLGITGRGKAAPGLSEGEGEGKGGDSSASSLGVGEASACATVCGSGKQGVLSNCKARACPAGVVIEGLAACAGSTVPAISVTATATASKRRTNDLL